MLGRGRLFKRPDDSDDSSDDDTSSARLVKAKPIDASVARKLDQIGANYQPRQFMTASAKSQSDFYGNQEVASTSTACASTRLLTADEKNKLSAKLLKAEMMGNKDLAVKLRKKLESGVASNNKGDEGNDRLQASSASSSNQTKDILLTKTDFRTGVTMPARTKERASEQASSNISDLMREEKMTSSEDQLAMFGALNPTTTDSKVTDDWTVDDVCITKTERKRKKRGRKEKDEKRRRDQAIKDFERHQETLESCRLCVESRKHHKHLVIAMGLKTYLCSPREQPLVDGHCLIVPMMHCSSAVQLDEDVYHEMRIWRKGLVAMFKAQDEDCVFIETAKNIRHQPHMLIECIPVPMEMADTLPIYFKKAILESDEEWASNKKLIDLSEKDIRRSIPKGFSYFAVDFGLQSGFAHVIENESLFPSTFGKEIVAGILDLEHTTWRKPKHLSRDEQEEIVTKMKRTWKPYDWTERARAALKDNDDD